MGPDVIEAWVDDVARSEPSVSGLETGRKRTLSPLRVMKANIPRGSHSIWGKGDSEKIISQSNAPRESIGERTAANYQEPEDRFNEDHGSISSPHATSPTTKIIPALTYHNVVQRNDTSPTLLSRDSTSTPSQSSQSIRLKSSVNQAQGLRKLPKPVNYRRLHERDLSNTMATVSKGSWALFKRIRVATNSRRGILPLQLRDYMLLDLGYKKGDDGSWGDEDIAFMFSERKPTVTPLSAYDATGDGTKGQLHQRRQELVAEACGRVKMQEDPAAAAKNDKFICISSRPRLQPIRRQQGVGMVALEA
ncbi:hypothetical protein GGR51DRAFT_536724 [Nemania sp. FL0031]|nr:hypothetical protein GGR51DRAFT_536724 [Nemania sp. FL0031]